MEYNLIFTKNTDDTNKYYSFITKKDYKVNDEFQDNFINFLITLFPCLQINNSMKGFDIIYDKMEEEIKNKNGFRNFLNEVDRYIKAYNSCLNNLGEDFKMSKMKPECWEILGRTEAQLSITEIRLSNTEASLAKTEENLANTEENFKKEIARLEKIIDDLRNK